MHKVQCLKIRKSVTLFVGHSRLHLQKYFKKAQFSSWFEFFLFFSFSFRHWTLCAFPDYFDKMRPFGKKKKRPRGATANTWKKTLICSVCTRQLEGAPSDPHRVTSFLANHDQMSRCRPRHCGRCACIHCFNPVTLNVPNVLSNMVAQSQNHKDLLYKLILG